MNHLYHAAFSLLTLLLTANGSKTETRGFLQGKDGWSKYKREVEGGGYSNGKIKIDRTTAYQKSDSLTVTLYTRKWLLGGKDKWLLTPRIPCNYETGINILTAGNAPRAPGDHVKFGISTWFDSKAFVDKWFPVKKNSGDFLFQFDGTPSPDPKAI
jgi:hypothetical protein